MEIKQLSDFVTLVGFNGALVVLLLWMGKSFLASLLNHISHIQIEMEKHTALLEKILIYSKRRKKDRKKNG